MKCVTKLEYIQEFKEKRYTTLPGLPILEAKASNNCSNYLKSHDVVHWQRGTNYYTSMVLTPVQ